MHSHLWLCWVPTAARRLSLAVASGGDSLVGGQAAVTSVAEHRLLGARASVLGRVGLVAPGRSPLNWQADP